jgi:hypothetical protein
LDPDVAADAQFFTSPAYVQLHGPANGVQIGRKAVIGPDIVAAPEFEELRPRQRSGSYQTIWDIRFLYCKVHVGQDILGQLHRFGLPYIWDVDLSRQLSGLLLGAARPRRKTQDPRRKTQDPRHTTPESGVWVLLPSLVHLHGPSTRRSSSIFFMPPNSIAWTSKRKSQLFLHRVFLVLSSLAACRLKDDPF